MYVCMYVGDWGSRLTHCWADEEFIVIVNIIMMLAAGWGRGNRGGGRMTYVWR